VHHGSSSLLTEFRQGHCILGHLDWAWPWLVIQASEYAEQIRTMAATHRTAKESLFEESLLEIRTLFQVFPSSF